MIVLDTSGLLSALDPAQRHHAPARRALEADPGPFVLSPFVLAETDYLVSKRVGVAAALALLGEVADGRYRLEPFSAEDVEAAAEVLDRYRDLHVGLTDASIVVMAARHRTTRILTIDERHFRAMRPLRGGKAFTLLPLDA